MVSPSTIILDTSIFLGGFREFAVENGRNYWFVEDMVQEVIHCIRYRPKAERRLDNFAAEVLLGEVEYEDGIIEKCYAIKILELGELLIKLLDELGAYDNGSLHYRVSVTSNLKLNDVVLKHKTLNELLDYSF